MSGILIREARASDIPAMLALNAQPGYDDGKLQQGRRLCKAMMDHAMKMASENGCYKLALSSSVKRVRAHAFYEKLGSRRYGYSFGVDLHQASTS